MEQQRARELVEAERKRVQRLLDESAIGQEDRSEADQPSDYGDQAQRLTAQATNDLLADELRERLAALDRAESRISDGTYGISIRSGERIPDERLEADPGAELTVEEAREDESRPA
jgi:RNA polymerase-binding transcription factor